MKRRKFLKYVGLGSIGSLVATKIAIEVTKVPQIETPVIKPITKIPDDIVIGDGWMSKIEDNRDVVLYSDHEGVKAFEEAIDSWGKHTEHNYLSRQMHNDISASRKLFEATKKSSKYF